MQSCIQFQIVKLKYCQCKNKFNLSLSYQIEMTSCDKKLSEESIMGAYEMGIIMGVCRPSLSSMEDE